MIKSLARILMVVIVMCLLQISPNMVCHAADAIPDGMPIPSQVGKIDCENDAAKKIGEYWTSSDSSCERELELTFKLTKDGGAYDIHLRKGFSDPYLIKSAYRAVLYAMPFRLPAVNGTYRWSAKCTLPVNTKTAPVSVVYTLAASGEPADAILCLQKAPPQKQYANDSIVRNWMYQRLSYLTDCLFRYPDYPEILTEVSKVFSWMGMTTANTHDWITYARTFDPDVVIMRNPGPEAVRSADSMVAAYFQAWRLKKDRAILPEFAQAYFKKAAYDVLIPSKADPLLLGSAALLTDQFSEAEAQYKRAVKNGNSTAGIFLRHMSGADAIPSAQSNIINSALTPKGQASDWETIIRWFPTDTEVVVTAKGPFYLSKAQDPKMPDYGSFNIAKQLRLLATALGTSRPNTKVEIANLLATAKINLGMHAGRAFKQPRGLGGGSQESAQVIIFAPDSTKIAEQLFQKIRSGCQSRELIEGIEILCSDERNSSPFAHGWSKGSTYYTCSPAAGVLIQASDRNYLSEVLARIKSEPADRALPADLPEWKVVDTQADVWAVRHYDKAHMPFDRSALLMDSESTRSGITNWGQRLDKQAIGLTVSAKTDGALCVRFLSGSEDILKMREKMWQSILSPRSGMWAPKELFGKAALQKSDIKINNQNRLLTIEGTTNAQTGLSFSLLLYDALGYMVNI